MAAANGAEAMRSGRAAVAAMKAMPTDDDCFGRASIRADGRFLSDLHLFQAKQPEESHGPWDVFRLVSSTSGADAYRPLGEKACPMISG
ncbi:MAG: hypothetical protein JOZ05_09040 [Acetobacteraceae bacterium]|nr:hypothetical protein [Acetobacteraceae bacterium]